MPPSMRSTLLATAFLGISSSFALADFQLNILHINDFHARIEQINKYDSTCSAEEDQKGECFGGIARIKTAVDQRRAELKDRNLLVLSAGDEFQGSLFYTKYKSAPIAEFMNGIGFDTAAIGNHEFDDGPDELAKFITALKFPLVSANTLSGLNTPISGKYQPYIVKEFGPEKVAIIGLLATDTDETSSPGKDVLFADEISTLKDEVKEIEGKGINKIVVLSHVGYERDKQIAAAVDGIDVIVGGHSHTLLLTGDDKAAGPYPTMVKDPAGVDVPIVTAYAYSKYLGDIEVTFDDKGVVKTATGAPKLLDKSVTPDAGFSTRVAELAKPLDDLRQKVVGEASAPIEGAREVCRFRECTMGSLVADAMLDRVKDQGVTIAITNGGGLRASIDQGPVTMGEVLTVLPFQNTVATFELKGTDIKAALENGVSKIEEGAGRFPQVAGMKFSFDLSKPAGSRVTSVDVKDGNDFKPIEDDKAYMVVSNNYMRGGGDGYSVFAKKGQKAYDYGPNLEDTVAAYLGAYQPYKPYTDGRIVQAAVKAVASGTETAPKAGEPAPNSAASTPNGAPPPIPAPDAKATTTAPAATPAPAPAAPAPAPAPAPAASTEAAAPAETAPSSNAANRHVVEKGDTLWVLARKYLGAGADWKKIAEANGGLKPRFLPVGKELVIPGK